MPNYTVFTGDFKMRLFRDSPLAAATDAFKTLQYRDKIELGVITAVTCETEEDIYLSTENLMGDCGESLVDCNHV